MKTDFPDPDDTLNFTLTIEPDEGMYKGGRFFFTFNIGQGFPHDVPKVKCTQKIYHPNIDLEGNVCLNILREDWKPVLNLQAIVIGLQVCTFSSLSMPHLSKTVVAVMRQLAIRPRYGRCMHLLTYYFKFLFLEPNASDPLNKEAAEDLRSNREGFKRNVRSSMGGGAVKGQNFDRVLRS